MGGVDSRMLWIRNLELRPSESHLLEAEVGSETRIVGQFSYEGGAVEWGPTTFEADSEGLLKYLVRMRIPSVRFKIEEVEAATKEGYFFSGGSLGEFIALVALQLQCRLYVLSTSTRTKPDDWPIKSEFAALRNYEGAHQDSTVFGSQRRCASDEMPPFLDRVRSVPTEYHLATSFAAEHYARALQEIGIDDEMLVVRLVSALEMASASHMVVDDPLSRKNFEEVFKAENLSSEEIEELKKLFQTRRAGSRFVSFVERYSSGVFEGELREPEHTQVTPETIKKVARAIYGARSGYLHGGIPMYISRRMPSFPRWHMDPSVGRTIHGRKFAAREKLPHTEFFHRLTRHCLIARINELTGAL